MQALEADAKSAGASGDDVKEGGKKELSQMIATAADDQQWNAFILTDAVQDCNAAEQKRTLSSGARTSALQRPRRSNGPLRMHRRLRK